jgi:ribonuclease P protein component
LYCLKGPINPRGGAAAGFTASAGGWRSRAAAAFSVGAAPAAANALRCNEAVADGPARLRFPRPARMRRRRDFSRTMREGRRVEGEAFTLYGLAAPAASRMLGVVCGKRVGGAVARNRARRRIREIFRTHPETFRDGRLFVVVAKAPAANAAYDALEHELLAALARITDGKNPA